MILAVVLPTFHLCPQIEQKPCNNGSMTNLFFLLRAKAGQHNFLFKAETNKLLQKVLCLGVTLNILYKLRDVILIKVVFIPLIQLDKCNQLVLRVQKSLENLNFPGFYIILNDLRRNDYLLLN